MVEKMRTIRHNLKYIKMSYDVYLMSDDLNDELFTENVKRYVKWSMYEIKAKIETYSFSNKITNNW